MSNSINDMREKVAEINELQKNVMNLFKLIEELQSVIQSQNELLDSIEENMKQVNHYMKSAVENMEKAKEEYMSAQEKSCCIFFVMLVLLSSCLLYVFSARHSPPLGIVGGAPFPLRIEFGLSPSRPSHHAGGPCGRVLTLVSITIVPAFL